LRDLLLVGSGGFLGSVARYLLGTAVATGISGRPVAAIPLGTLVVNVLGCLVIGALAASGAHRGTWNDGARLFLFTGVLGGFTTFSAFGYETFSLAREGRLGLAAVNVLLQTVCGLLAVFAGYRIVAA
jgi:CrcB protein